MSVTADPVLDLLTDAREEYARTGFRKNYITVANCCAVGALGLSDPGMQAWAAKMARVNLDDPRQAAQASLRSIYTLTGFPISWHLHASMYGKEALMLLNRVTAERFPDLTERVILDFTILQVWPFGLIEALNQHPDGILNDNYRADVLGCYDQAIAEREQELAELAEILNPTRELELV